MSVFFWLCMWVLMLYPFANFNTTRQQRHKGLTWTKSPSFVSIAPNLSPKRWTKTADKWD